MARTMDASSGRLDDFVDEHAVDLEFVDREAAQVAHARVAGAEVVDRDQHSHGAQLLENRDRLSRDRS